MSPYSSLHGGGYPPLPPLYPSHPPPILEQGFSYDTVPTLEQLFVAPTDGIDLYTLFADAEAKREWFDEMGARTKGASNKLTKFGEALQANESNLASTKAATEADIRRLQAQLAGAHEMLKQIGEAEKAQQNLKDEKAHMEYVIGWNENAPPVITAEILSGIKNKKGVRFVKDATVDIAKHLFVRDLSILESKEYDEVYGILCLLDEVHFDQNRNYQENMDFYLQIGVISQDFFDEWDGEEQRLLFSRNDNSKTLVALAGIYLGLIPSDGTYQGFKRKTNLGKYGSPWEKEPKYHEESPSSASGMMNFSPTNSPVAQNASSQQPQPANPTASAGQNLQQQAGSVSSSTHSMKPPPSSIGSWNQQPAAGFGAASSWNQPTQPDAGATVGSSSQQTSQTTCTRPFGAPNPVSTPFHFGVSPRAAGSEENSRKQKQQNAFQLSGKKQKL